jgi:hypothetical protein
MSSVRRGASGGKKEFWKYSKALKFLNRALELNVYDAALNCKRMGFDPPSRFVRIKGKFVKGTDGQMRQATKRVFWDLPVSLRMDQVEHKWCGTAGVLPCSASTASTSD